jgi:hypothetical protein
VYSAMPKKQLPSSAIYTDYKGSSLRSRGVKD